MNKQSQKEIVLNQLYKKGHVSNFWAIENYILRLGDIIFRLKNEGYDIEGDFAKNIKNFRSKEEKNWVYVLAPHYERVGKDLCFIK